MKFIDIEAQQKKIRQPIESAIKRVLDHGKYIMGPEVMQLEEALSQFVDSRHCIAVANGTDALLIAMMALDIGPGDEVIAPAFSYIAALEMIVFLGATPVLVDVDERTFNLDVSKLESAITSKTKAIVPVNLFGQCCDFDAINQIAKKHNLPVIEDAAQSMGATYKGRRSCHLSTIATTSFFPAKPLGCYGDGGACFTDDDELAERMKQIHVHGQAQKYQHVRVGMNSRLDTIQAAILLEKLKIFPEEIELRQQVADRYNTGLGTNIQLPFVEAFGRSVYAQYVIRLEDRDSAMLALKKQGIPSIVHYPEPLHKQPAYKEQIICSDKLFTSEELSGQVLSLPMHPYINASQQDLIIETLVSELN
ncbi:MAG: aminotransferase DegT [Legionellaceae bacterium]|nr:aminotransferase DegT [Legionellaceae bacterium]